MAFTKEEETLLSKLAAGNLDGIVGNLFTNSGGSTIWMSIKDGIPRKYKQGPGKRLFGRGEGEWIPGVLHLLQEWKSDQEKLSFLAAFGWLMEDEGVKKYSAKYK